VHLVGNRKQSGRRRLRICLADRPISDASLAALLEVIEQEVPLRQLGRTQTALTTYLGRLINNLNVKLYGRIIRGLISDLAVDQELARGFREQVLARRVTEAKALLQRGIERGELRSDLDTEIAIDLLFGPIYYRLLVSGEPLTRAFIDRLVRAVMAYGR